MYYTPNPTTPKVMHYECIHELPNGEVRNSYGTVPVFSEAHGDEMIRKWNVKPVTSSLVPGTKYHYKLLFFADVGNVSQW